MKCQSCGHKSKEEQPKFCSECGTRLFLPVPSKVNEAASTTSIGGVELSSISPNQLGDRKEVKNQEEINKKECEGGTGPPMLNTILSTGIEDSNTGKSDEDNNDCKIAEDSQPVSLMVETLTPSCLLAQDSVGKIIPKDQENESNVQETTITTPNNQFQHKEKMVGMEEKSENSVQTDSADSKILTTTSCSIEGESVEEKQMTTNENNYDDNGKDKVEISTEDGVNYGTMSQSVNEEAKSNACKTSNLDYSSESLAQAFGTEHNNAAHVEKQTNILDKQELHNVTETRNENSSHKVKCKEECELETNLLSKNNKKDNSSSNQNRGNRDKDTVPNKETTSMNTPEAEPKRNMEQTSKKTFDVKDNENGKETVSINVTENVSKYVKKTKEPEQKVSSVVNAPKQQNVKTVASEKMRDNEEEQEPAVREIDPLNYITVYFHVIVSTNFEINPNEDNVVVKAGTLKGYQEWSDVVCEMTFTNLSFFSWTGYRHFFGIST